MPVQYINKNGSNVWTSLDSKHILPICCNLCAVSLLKEGSFLCDYPMHGDKTCDAVLCNAHANRVATNINQHDHNGDFTDDIHLCPSHYDEWLRNGSIKFWEK